jgi:L-ascorbate metabolism protein UlaG (beta-lactamase superfamily)
VDVALLPISGWGPRLGPGHMDPEEAARATVELRPGVVVPIHWGTFRPLGSRGRKDQVRRDPAHLFAARVSELAPDVTVSVLAPGESMALVGA